MGASGYGCVRGRAQATRFLRLRRSVGRRPAFLGRIACPTPTTTAAAAAHSRHPRSTSTLLAEAAGQRLHLELVLRFLREISPQESISARHKTTKRGRHGSPHAWAATKVPSCGLDPTIAATAANRRAVPPKKAGLMGGEKSRSTASKILTGHNVKDFAGGPRSRVFGRG